MLNCLQNGLLKNLSLSGLFIYLLLLSPYVSGQQIAGLQYISPMPGSTNIGIQTNIIIRFVSPLSPKNNFDQIMRIYSGETSFPFQVIKQNDPNKLILKPDNDLPLYSKIIIESSEIIHTLKGDNISPFRFNFQTYKSSGFTFIPNESWMPKPGDAAQPVTNKEAGNTTTAKRSIQNDFLNQIHFDMSISEKKADDYYFMASMFYTGNNKDRCMIVNGLGQLIYERLTPIMSFNFRKFEDSTFCFANCAAKPEETNFIVLDKNFKELDTVKAGNGYNTDIHELIKDEKTGHYYILAQRVIDVDMSTLVVNGRADAKLLDLVIQELDANNNVLFEWKCFDHLPVTDAYGVDLLESGPIDYIHCNGIMLDTDTTLLLSSRHFNEVTRIDRRNGNIIWRFGPTASTNNFLFDNDPTGFTYQHHAQKLPNGNILLFDNGNYKYGYRFSRAVEYRLNEVSMHAEKVWEYRHAPDISTDFMGSVQRLPNGNTVIGWGSATPSFTEVDESGNIVNEGTLPEHVLNYRVFKYHIPELMSNLQPKFTMPEPFTMCKLNDHNFVNKTKIFIQPFVDENVSTDFQSMDISNDKLTLVLEDTLTHFYSYHERKLLYKYVGLAQKDTIICDGVGLYKLNLNDGCQNSSYVWSNGATTAQVDYSTREDANKIWVTTQNGLLQQTDSILLNVTPVSNIELIGESILDKPFQITTYSLPYYKGAKYNWKALNGNIISGFESNSIQVQWGNKPQGYLKGIITDNYGCEISTPWDTIFYQKNQTGISELTEKTGVTVFPSPFHNVINMDGTKPYSYALFDLSGKLLFESKNELTGVSTIETTDLPAAIYVLKLSTDQNQVFVKMLKE